MEGRGLPERLLIGREPADLDGEGWPVTASEGLSSPDEDRADVRLTRPEGNLEGLGSWAEGNLGGPGDWASREEPGDWASREEPGDWASREEPGDWASREEPGDWASREEPGDWASREEPGDWAEGNLGGPGECAESAFGVYSVYHMTIT